MDARRQTASSLARSHEVSRPTSTPCWPMAVESLSRCSTVRSGTTPRPISTRRAAGGVFSGIRRTKLFATLRSGRWPSMADEPPVPLLRGEFQRRNPEYSPDGNWLAYRSDESGSPGSVCAGRIRVLDRGGAGLSRWRRVNPVWARDGSRLYLCYRTIRLMALPYQPRRSDRQVGSASPVFEAGRLQRERPECNPMTLHRMGAFPGEPHTYEFRSDHVIQTPDQLVIIPQLGPGTHRARAHPD